MRWSWKVATIANIQVRIHATFILLLVFVFWLYISRGNALGEAITGVVLICLLFLCVLLHEFGHALMARRFGITTRDITLLPIGGVARLERMPDDPKQEILVAFAGPAVNGVIAAALFVILGAQLLAGMDFAKLGLLGNLFWANVFLAVFNMIPAFPMDGGRVLRALLATRLPYVRATQIAATVGQAAAFLFGFVGLFWNPLLIFIALFVYLGASEEAALVMMRSSFRGIPVAQAMISRYQTLAPSDPLSLAVQHMLAGWQHDFPVVEGDRPLGVLTRTDLVVALEKAGPSAPVSEAMSPACWTVEASEMLDGVFQRMKSEGCSALPVTQAGRIVGLLTLDNVGEFVMVQTALSKGRQAGAAV